MLIRQGLSGRVQPIDAQYLAEPATCCMCARPPRDPREIFLNLGVELDFFGFLYLCSDCAVEIGESVGSVPHEQHIAVSSLAEEQDRIITENDNQIAYLKGLLDARIDLARFSKPDGNGPVDVSLFENESGQDDVDSIINGIESEPIKSGKD